ncbi:TRAP transporter large permease [uncultured Alsobacter sp.]|uniref:TRAP transporter large permease n=1 Tax=uncultured Alsobacter sp. TaxID=1748258 RepID=UPI0025DB3B4C|nr:TRAP transporter large permease [uncultured Alsobacter sp.]
MSLAVGCLVATFVLLSVLRVPIAYAMFSGSIVYLWVSGQDVGLVVDQTMNTLSGLYVLLAVPMFILAANVMNATTISDRLWAAADALVGRWRGGVGHVTVLVNIVFSGISGSAVTDAAGPGMLAMKMMRDVSRYPAGFSAALIAAASTIAPIIPPSIPMILYALLSGASVGALFLGGVVPGLLMAGSLMVAIAITARTRGLPRGEAVPMHKLPGVLGRALVPMTLPLVLLGGLFSGVFTPTEAAAVAAIYAILLGIIVYRNLGPRTLMAVMLESARQSAVVMVLIASAFVVNYAITSEQIAVRLADAVSAWHLQPLAFLLAVNALFLVLGCFLDASVLLLVFVPVLLPAAKALGLDMVHFGVVVIVNLMIGLITPPYGLLLFVLAALGRVPLMEIVREIWIFIVPLMTVLLLLIVFPDFVLALPRWAGMIK